MRALEESWRMRRKNCCYGSPVLILKRRSLEVVPLLSRKRSIGELTWVGV